MKFANIAFMVICLVNIALFTGAYFHNHIWFMMVDGFFALFTFLGACVNWKR